MGSSSSSHVKNIKLEQKPPTGDSRRAEDSNRHKSFRNSKVSSEVDQPQVQISPQKNESSKDDNDKTVLELEKQLIESESQRLDLEDQVQLLEEKLEYYDNQNVLKEEKTCDETLHAKDQYIAKLEKEKSDLELESNKMKQRSRKKIKLISSKLSEFKQEANFTMMELREEITRLKEQNMLLQKGDGKAVSSSDVGGTDGLPGGEKMKLILELSAQVTEQNEKISKLERKLKDKDQIVDELRVKLKNNMEYLKARDEVDSLRKSSGDKNSNKASGRTHSSDQNYNRKAFPARKTADSATKIWESSSNDVNSLFAVNEEESDDDFDDSDKMEKLTSMLKGVKAKTDNTRHSMDSLDDKLSDSDELLSTKIKESETRKFSGTSRDSGVGSAGKQRTVQNNAISSLGQKESSFSLATGLSDSDLDDEYNHSKIASAPPYLERSHPGQKLKKISSLKRRASKKNENLKERAHIPKPSLAFVNNSEAVISDESLFKIPGSSGLSSVQVS